MYVCKASVTVYCSYTSPQALVAQGSTNADINQASWGLQGGLWGHTERRISAGGCDGGLGDVGGEACGAFVLLSCDREGG